MALDQVNPVVLLVEDNPLDAQLAEIHLSTVGFEVIHCASLIESYACAVQLLDHASARPCVIVCDIHMPQPSHARLMSPIVVALLTQQMQQGLIRPAHMIAISNHLTEQIEEEALFAGCSHMVAKPFTYKLATLIFTLLDVACELAPQTVEQRLYQAKAQEIFNLVQQATLPNTWTELDIQLVLNGVTHYPIKDGLNVSRQAALVLGLGGKQAVRQRLHTCAQELDEPHASILMAYLDGKMLRDLASMFDDYDRSTIYRYSQALPSRVLNYFQFAVDQT